MGETGSVFDGRLRPITDGFAFIEAPAPVVAAAFIEWYRNSSESRAQLRDELQTAGLETALRSLAPLFRTGPTKRLFVPTGGNWTACFDNGARGVDPTIWDHLGSSILGVRTVWHCIWPHTRRKVGDAWTGRSGARMFAVYEPSTTAIPDRVRRYIALDLSGADGFRSFGAPMPFERTSTPRRKADRLTGEMVVEYLAALGIRVHDDAFYTADERNPAHLIQTPLNEVEREGISLEQARAAVL